VALRTSPWPRTLVGSCMTLTRQGASTSPASPIVGELGPRRPQPSVADFRCQVLGPVGVDMLGPRRERLGETATRSSWLRRRADHMNVAVKSISIIDADPELEDLVPPSERERARRETRTQVRHLSTGDWDVAAAEELDSHHRGFLIVDGLISREVEVLGRRCVELLGAGDVIRPWSWDDEGSHVQAEVGWIVLEPARLAVLNNHLVVRMVPWPQLGLELFNRGTRRAHALAVSLAIAHHQRVDDRLLLTLWHLAERWGRVLPEGIAVPLPLSHQRLADLVGAHRPAVTSAIGALTRQDRISRRTDRTWILHGSPPEELRHHRLAATLS
jgi:CRP/FNR family transcriptional regulator, cyclic AMP receptor protein